MTKYPWQASQFAQSPASRDGLGLGVAAQVRNTPAGLKSGATSIGSRPAAPAPEIRRRLDGDDFKINEVFPSARPGSQRIRVLRLHNLKTAIPAGGHPA